MNAFNTFSLPTYYSQRSLISLKFSVSPVTDLDMNTRKMMINIHLVLAALFMPLLLIMPFTGASYLLGFKGDQTKTEAFRIPTATLPEDMKEKEQFFRDEFKKQNIDFSFEYIKESGKSLIFRPATRIHYVASVEKDTNEIIVTKVDPTLLLRLIELHKGHGPTMMRGFEAIFGIALILTTLSGLWLAWTAKPYRKITLISFAIGCSVILICLI